MGIFSIILMVTYIPCSLLSYGLFFAYIQREWPTLAKEDYADDRFKSIIISLFGPISLIIISMITRGRHGTKW